MRIKAWAKSAWIRVNDHPPFQVAYVQCLANVFQLPLNDEEWAMKNMGSNYYFLARFERLKENPVVFTTQFYEVMDLDVDVDALEKRIKESGFAPDSLQLEKYKTKNPDTVAKIEAISAETLVRFGYR